MDRYLANQLRDADASIESAERALQDARDRLAAAEDAIAQAPRDTLGREALRNATESVSVAEAVLRSSKRTKEKLEAFGRRTDRQRLIDEMEALHASATGESFSTEAAEILEQARVATKQLAEAIAAARTLTAEYQTRSDKGNTLAASLGVDSRQAGISIDLPRRLVRDTVKGAIESASLSRWEFDAFTRG
jgi:hypothetical protein